MEPYFIYLVLAIFVTFTSYVLYIVSNFGVLESISDSWYVLPKNRKPLFWLFTVCIGIPLLFFAGSTAPWFFLAGAGFVFVGTASAFNDDTVTNRVHYAGATIGIVFSFVGLYFDYGLFYPLFAFLISLPIIYYYDKKNLIWWLEISAFITVIAGLLDVAL